MLTAGIPKEIKALLTAKATQQLSTKTVGKLNFSGDKKNEKVRFLFGSETH